MEFGELELVPGEIFIEVFLNKMFIWADFSDRFSMQICLINLRQIYSNIHETGRHA